MLAELGEEIAPVTDALSALELVGGQVMTLLDLLKDRVASLTELVTDRLKGSSRPEPR